MKFSDILFASIQAAAMVAAKTEGHERRTALAENDFNEARGIISEVAPKSFDTRDTLTVAEIMERQTDLAELMARGEAVSIGLDPKLWVDISAACASCMLTCMIGMHGFWNAYPTPVANTTVWGQINDCGATCSLQGDCDVKYMAATWAAKQDTSPISTHSKN
ncbi:hypothetical protein SCUP234_07059 [Seiridium cupressi]